MILLALDLSSVALGAVTVNTQTGKMFPCQHKFTGELQSRFVDMHDRIARVLREAKPDLIIYERPVRCINFNTMLACLGAAGIALAAIGRHVRDYPRVPTVAISPSSWQKVFIVGKRPTGKKLKQLVRQKVTEIFPALNADFPTMGEDAFDAVAMAYAYLKDPGVFRKEEI